MCRFNLAGRSLASRKESRSPASKAQAEQRCFHLRRGPGRRSCVRIALVGIDPLGMHSEVTILRGLGEPCATKSKTPTQLDQHGSGERNMFQRTAGGPQAALPMTPIAPLTKQQLADALLVPSSRHGADQVPLAYRSDAARAWAPLVRLSCASRAPLENTHTHTHRKEPHRHQFKSRTAVRIRRIRERHIGPTLSPHGAT